MRNITSIIFAFIISGISLIAHDHNNETLVTPHPSIKLTPYQNIVYSASFHLAWKELQNKILKSKVKTKRPVKLVYTLNESNPDVINNNDHFSTCGFAGNGICKQIYISMRSKFNTFVDIFEYNDDPFNIICYSYFRKHLEFESKFETIEQPQPFFHNGKSSSVKYFGIWTANKSKRHEGIRKQVKIVDHKDENNFIISISNEHSSDELLFVMSNKFNPDMTLGSAIKYSAGIVNSSQEERLVDNDRLLIPKVDLNLTHHYDELYGVHLANEGYKDYFFSAAIHNIGFKLNESGAFADSEAKLILKKGPGRRTMIINKPFLVLMKEKNSDKPYFVAWIVNPELLVKEDKIKQVL
ncbi:hypothetical protein ACFLS9_00590 [Bacteroidota bacterium]